MQNTNITSEKPECQSPEQSISNIIRIKGKIILHKNEI